MFNPADVVYRRGKRPVRTPAGSHLPLGCRITTGRKGEHGRRWVSKLHDVGGADLALWNPITFGHTVGVLDDFGEQLPPGPGDLLLRLRVERAPARTSLAFLNDHGYFEGNRRYTIHVRDSEGHFLAGCTVEDFLTPVYKHFAVVKAADLVIHVYRDCSLNTLLSGLFVDPLWPPERGPAERARRRGPTPVAEVATLRGFHTRAGIQANPATDLSAERSLARSAQMQRALLRRLLDSLEKSAHHQSRAVVLDQLSSELHDAAHVGFAYVVDQELLADATKSDTTDRLSLALNLAGRFERNGQPGLGILLLRDLLKYTRAVGGKPWASEQVSSAVMELISQGRHALAEALLEAALSYRVHRARGRHREAAEALESLISDQRSTLVEDLPEPEVEGSIGTSSFHLACHYAAAGEPAKAERALERAERYTEDRNQLANARYLIGLQCLRQPGGGPAAARHFRHLISQYGDTHWAAKAKFYLEKTRDQRPKTRDPRPETRDPRPETQDQRPETQE